MLRRGRLLIMAFARRLVFVVRRVLMRRVLMRRVLMRRVLMRMAAGVATRGGVRPTRDLLS